MSKINHANTIDRDKKVKEKSSKALWVYVRSKYTAAKDYLKPGSENGQAFSKELKEIVELIRNVP